MDLYTSYYEVEKFDRQLEIESSIISNLKNENFNRIFIFTEKDYNLNKKYKVSQDRLREIKLSRVPTYKDWIENTIFNKSKFSIFCNSDISFDNSISFVKKHIEKNKSILCLSNFDKEMPWWSQDTWAITFDNAKNIDFIESIDIRIGNVRCDNKFAYYFSLNGWDIYNPCYDIKAYHKHSSGIRNYSKTDPVNLENVALVYPSENNSPSKIVYAFFSLHCKNVVGMEISPYMCKDSTLEDKKIFEEKIRLYKK